MDEASSLARRNRQDSTSKSYSLTSTAAAIVVASSSIQEKAYGNAGERDGVEMLLDAASEQMMQQQKRVYHEVFVVVMPMFWWVSESRALGGKGPTYSINRDIDMNGARDGSGYAALFALQEKLSEKLIPRGSPDDTQSVLFAVAVSMLYIGNLLFRLGHNVVCSFGAPPVRVVRRIERSILEDRTQTQPCMQMISMVGLCCSMAILAFIMYLDGVPDFGIAISLVFVAYLLGGASIGSFESNVLATAAVTHEQTQLLAVLAIPVRDMGVILAATVTRRLRAHS